MNNKGYNTNTSTQTLSNKTLKNTIIQDNKFTVNSKNLTIPSLTQNDEIVTKNFAQVLTNKTLTTPNIETPNITSGSLFSWKNGNQVEITLPNITDTLVTVSGEETLSLERG